ncbi:MULTISPECIES: hypothetical protein [Okeania]|uniref:hypothetical protein n=1 Tax=Okeania TaxID=1458928 RepID=UPI0013749C00|nr:MULTISPECIES: hypothetical protein [Okeania]NEP07872.1 hypothetical protein [Okeania sp. SIO4D6]NEP44987.1 hypothetical protein [Okeania sp. SIO2H7]NET16293.1 hypothetical protein [Okeania sp. SIO1H6]NEP74576.1 hypothetical protein [Okeania sp. SIO2G5]NEP95637.1 hypothetical protein [Okeania sp. SIO2F5]
MAYKLKKILDIWGNVGTEFGPSEFVVRVGAEVEIDSVMNTVEYVQENSALSQT